MPTDLDPEQIDDILNSEETWVIDFWADWCAPCHKLEPHFNEVAEKMDEVNFGKLDMEAHQSVGSKLGVRALPTILIIQNGEEVARQAGLVTADELEGWIQESI